jgi:hypothetical protein
MSKLARNNPNFLVFPFVTFIGFFLWVVVMHPILLKIVGGYFDISDTARFLFPPEECSVRIDGLLDPNIKCFPVKSDFSGKGVRRLILVLKDSPVIIVDIDNNDAGRPNSSDMDYSLLFGKILVQARSGYSYLSFSNPVKFCGENPDMHQQMDEINFRVPCGYKSLKDGSNLVITISK